MNKPQTDDEFATDAKTSQPGLMREFLEFLVYNKRWWLTPLVIVLLILGLMITVTNTAIGPAIYLMF